MRFWTLFRFVQCFHSNMTIASKIITIPIRSSITHQRSQWPIFSSSIYKFNIKIFTLQISLKIEKLKNWKISILGRKIHLVMISKRITSITWNVHYRIEKYSWKVYYIRSKLIFTQWRQIIFNLRFELFSISFNYSLNQPERTNEIGKNSKRKLKSFERHWVKITYSILIKRVQSLGVFFTPKCEYRNLHWQPEFALW